MLFKKTFWMNVVFAIFWILFCIVFFATDMDYVEHTLTHKILSLFTQLLILTTSIITAVHLFKLNKSSISKVILFANYASIAVLIGYLLIPLYYQPSKFISMDFLYLTFFYGLFIAPFVINLIALRSCYE
jgi:hypothetical protein